MGEGRTGYLECRVRLQGMRWRLGAGCCFWADRLSERIDSEAGRLRFGRSHLRMR